MLNELKKQDPTVCCLQETCFTPKNMYRLNVKGTKKTFHVNRIPKKQDIHTYTRKNRLYIKSSEDRQGGSFIQ
jgi:sulfate adenylyltransferase subunit 1 (EFTu-like GTPase family)